jgi:epoxyqueuosine reductase
MDWMAANASRRANPRELWPDVRSVIMLGVNYGPDADPIAVLSDKAAGNISVYARHRDYHDLIKGRLKQLASWLMSEATRGGVLEADVKVFVDTAPVMEKPLAAAAGIGWQGKHTNLVSREFGSWLFLGSIFTTLDLEPDAPDEDHCGTCRACLDICPTRAFPAPYQLDARRCISYLTIEHRGQIPREFRAAIGNRIYGCDDCLAVCPWNKFAASAREAKLQARDDLVAPRLAMLASLDDVAFRALFSGSPVKRIGSARFLRNVLVAIGNSGDLELAPVVQEKLTHESPLVRGMAVWALARLLSSEEFRALAQAHLSSEAEESVRAEWQEELGGLADSNRGAEIAA